MPEDTTPTFAPVPVPTVDELSSFDPLSTPSPVVVKGNVRITAEPSMGMLSPEMKARVTEKLSHVPVAQHADVTQGFIYEELRQHSLALRVKMGTGPGANEYQREYFGIAREAYDLDQEIARISAELEDVTGYTHDVDENGEPVATPIYRFAPETRQGRAEHLQNLRYRRSQLERETASRLSEAAARERKKLQNLNKRASVEREGRELADQLDLSGRIEARAKAINANRQSSWD